MAPEEVVRRRLKKLDQAIRPQSFKDWYKTDRALYPQLSSVDMEAQTWWVIQNDFTKGFAHDCF